MTEQSDGVRRVEVRVGDFDLWYRVPAGLPLSVGGEFLLAAGLLPAMQRNQTLVLPPECPVDPALLGRLAEIQTVYLAWQDALGLSLSRIEVVAEPRRTPVEPAVGALSFFSGGVDSSYTAFTNRGRITAALLLRGIDMQLSNTSLWEEAQAGASRLAARWGMPLFSLETNVRYLCYHHGMSWARHFQVVGLSSVAHLVPHAEVLIASSHSMDHLVPHASHPLLDPLWSSSTTRIVHDGPVHRTEKLRALATSPEALAELRVCWHDAGYNCGHCDKCVRTMTALTLLGVSSPRFPGVFDVRRMDAMREERGGWHEFLLELDILEKEFPHREIRRQLDRMLRSHRLRAGVRLLDEAFGAPIARLRRRGRAAAAPRSSQPGIPVVPPDPALDRSAASPTRSVLIYDGHCTVCGRIVAMLRRWDREGRLEVVASQDAGMAERFPGITPEEYRQSIQLVAPDGTRWQGAAAVEHAVDLLPKGGFVTWIFSIPFARPIAERGYRTFARNRYRLGCGDHCEYRPAGR